MMAVASCPFWLVLLHDLRPFRQRVQPSSPPRDVVIEKQHEDATKWKTPEDNDLHRAHCT